jgi:DNA-directed RNA polymerase subunit RPC12/RpoP
VSEERCSNCGAELPRGTGQHAAAPAPGLVTCPHCGATNTLSKPGADPEQAAKPTGEAPGAEPRPPGRPEADESFSGEETLSGVMEEVEDKEGGPGDIRGIERS